MDVERSRIETDVGRQTLREVSIMEFEGEFVVNGTPEEVWPYFNDPDILQDCAPGCEEMVLESPSRLRTTLSVSVGSVKPTFDVDAVVVECDRPNRLELRASGEASRNSFEVTAWQELSDNGDGTTTVLWGADAQVSGIIASLGERALESVTRKLVNDFFTDIEAHISSGTPAEAKFEAVEEVDEAIADRVTPAVDEPVSVEGDNVGRYILAGGVIGALAVLLWSWLRRRRRSDVDDEAIAKDDGDDIADTASGGRLRYLLAGVAIGAVGKLLWDRYTATDSIEATAPQVGQSDGRTDTVETTDLTGTPDEVDETETGTAEPEESETADENTDEGEQANADDSQEGMIDDPLDRLR